MEIKSEYQIVLPHLNEDGEICSPQQANKKWVAVDDIIEVLDNITLIFGEDLLEDDVKLLDYIAEQKKKLKGQ